MRALRRRGGANGCHAPAADRKHRVERIQVCSLVRILLSLRSATLSAMSVRDRVLQAALDCFTEDGYERTTIARIRERSGVSNGAL